MPENREKTGRFRPGRSGNPGGRPREDVHVRELARQHTAEAIETLTTIMRRGKTKAARVRAAEALLARGWGQPGQLVGIGTDGGPLDIIVRYVGSSGPADAAK